MNRAERRRQEREERRRGYVSVPTGGRLVRADVLTPGGVEEVTNWRQIPAKRPSVHRWICTVAHYFTDEQAEAWNGRTPDSPVLLDASNIMFAGLGCVDCNEPYEDALGEPCRAGDEWEQ